MTGWEVWGQGDQAPFARFEDRVDAVASALLINGRVVGAEGPACRTNRELASRLRRLGEELDASGRSLSEYLQGLGDVGAALKDREEIDPDLFAGMLVAAARGRPSCAVAGPPAAGYPTWEQIIRAQAAEPDGPTPREYLERAMECSFGGWNGGATDPGLAELPELSWDDLAEFALCGRADD